MSVSFQNISVRLGGKQILDGVSLETREGRVTGIVGPNGSGKSTLIKTLFGIVRKESGNIVLKGADISTLSRKQIARQVGYVGQETSCVFDFTVTEVVEMALSKRKDRSRKIVDTALDELGISHLAHHSILTLSGGERKMVFLARAIAQGADTIILDEPTNHLDIRHQMFILDYLKQSGKTVLVVLHDLNMAALYCDELYVLQRGKVVCAGTASQVLTPELIQKVYEVDSEVITDSRGELRILFHSSRGKKPVP